uniref:AlNc14C568G12169 protein n=1 Tax=Albugo laibachii Nc14 TaxID=890382 RepID=F0X175_9STRA|nr:AlNc14C568G12169 [Albugo laibachii Nc14]|eukprot:CCA27533.1 AlNc14C568G12169 [Albugo laibachii Nc14]
MFSQIHDAYLSTTTALFPAGEIQEGGSRVKKKTKLQHTQEEVDDTKTGIFTFQPFNTLVTRSAKFDKHTV